MTVLITSRPHAVPVAPVDRRTHDRVPLRRAAMLEAGGRRSAVVLLDLSEGGVAVEGMSLDVTMGVSAALMLDTALIPASVVALEDGRVHLAFAPLSPAARAVVRRVLDSGPASSFAL